MEAGIEKSCSSELTVRLTGEHPLELVLNEPYPLSVSRDLGTSQAIGVSVHEMFINENGLTDSTSVERAVFNFTK